MYAGFNSLRCEKAKAKCQEFKKFPSWFASTLWSFFGDIFRSLFLVQPYILPYRATSCGHECTGMCGAKRECGQTEDRVRGGLLIGHWHLITTPQAHIFTFLRNFDHKPETQTNEIIRKLHLNLDLEIPWMKMQCPVNRKSCQTTQKVSQFTERN